MWILIALRQNRDVFFSQAQATRIILYFTLAVRKTLKNSRTHSQFSLGCFRTLSPDLSSKWHVSNPPTQTILRIVSILDCISMCLHCFNNFHKLILIRWSWAIGSLYDFKPLWHTSTQVITRSPFSRSQSVNTLMAGSSFWPVMAFSKLDSTQSRRISVLDAMDDSLRQCWKQCEINQYTKLANRENQYCWELERRLKVKPTLKECNRLSQSFAISLRVQLLQLVFGQV